MIPKSLTYFVSDVHLGLQVADPADRERRFVDFLRSLPENTDALYLLGDIWDFWYEYKHVVPKGYVRVFAALTDLMDRGVKVYFFQGNHDVWTYRYFEELGMIKLIQPAVVDISGKKFCVGHGDGLVLCLLAIVSFVACFIIACCSSSSASSTRGLRSGLETDGRVPTVFPMTRSTVSGEQTNLCTSLQTSLHPKTRSIVSSSATTIPTFI